MAMGLLQFSDQENTKGYVPAQTDSMHSEFGGAILFPYYFTQFPIKVSNNKSVLFTKLTGLLTLLFIKATSPFTRSLEKKKIGQYELRVIS